jgi:hypothetical protein
MSSDPSGSDKVLRGLDGINPLGYLSALGVLAVISSDHSIRARMSWSEEDTWHPVLRVENPITDEQLSDRIYQSLKKKTTELELGDNVVVGQDVFKAHAIKVVDEARSTDRTSVDLMTNFGCTICMDEESGKIYVTPFCFIKGSGHQYFLKTVRDLIGCVDQKKIHQCLFDRWTYNDPKHSMRWDPVEDRRYALMWENPSGSPPKTVWAANLLAYRGLQLFPSVVRDGQLETTGFTRMNKKDFFSWPIWEGMLSTDSVRSVLAQRELRDEVPDRERLHRMGIREVYRSERLRIGKFANFSPAGPV